MFVTIASAGLGLLVTKARQAQQQREGVEAILKFGGVVRYDYQFNSRGIYHDDASMPKPAWLRELVGVDFFAYVTYVGLHNRSFTDGDLVHLRGMTKLNRLDLESTGVSDAGLIHLKGFRQLKILRLYDTDVTDAGLVHLLQLDGLEFLNLQLTKTTSKGRETLKKALPKLDISPSL